MGRQLTIKEIAAKAGVSAGTVDRVIHNRGKVSIDKEEKVRAILEEIDFKLNIHTSVISIKKKYELVICTPEYSKGEYWAAIQEGFKSALDEFNDLSITCTHITFNQFDASSCHDAYLQVLERNSNAVIIGPIFEKETKFLCSELDKKGVPYAFVDSIIEDTSPIASLMADQPAGGKLICRLLESISGGNSKILLCRPRLSGMEPSYNYSQRLKGFYDYLELTNQKGKVKEVYFSMDDRNASAKAIISVFKEHPDIKGIAVLNSRGYFIADILAENNLKEISVASFDLSWNNIRCLENGSISVLLGQRPMTQGFCAVKAVIEHLIYRKKEKTFVKMPIDIVVKDNLPFYKDLPIIIEKPRTT